MSGVVGKSPGRTGGPPSCSRVFGRHSRLSESGREALLDVQEWSGCLPECPGVVGRPFKMSGSGREALPDVQEWSKGYPESPRVIRRHSQMSGGGQEAFSDFRERSGGPPGCPGVVGVPYGCPGMVGRPSRMSGNGEEAIPEVRNALSNIHWHWHCSLTLEEPPSTQGHPGVSPDHSRMSLSGWRLFWMSGSCREPPGCPGGPPGCLGVIGRPSWMSGSGRKDLLDVRDALPYVWEWSGSLPECPRVVGRTSQLSGSGREAFRMPGCGRETLPYVR